MSENPPEGVPTPEAQEYVRRTMDTLERRALLRRIAALWRGDWTGVQFDGRDGNRWITTALDGSAAALERLDAELKRLEADE